MYVPADYRTPDPSWVADLAGGNPLALLCTNGDGTPHATHLPVITCPDSAFEPGGMLVGHMNRANPHWSSLASGGGALLVFTGPQAYVSPTVYAVTPAAPTWDFTAVHVRGAIERIEDPGETMSVIRATVSAFESRFGNDWDMAPSFGYFDKIVPGVGAFRFQIGDIQAMFKLSQEQRPEVRRRVWRSFADSHVGQHRALADLIARADERDQ